MLLFRSKRTSLTWLKESKRDSFAGDSSYDLPLFWSIDWLESFLIAAPCKKPKPSFLSLRITGGARHSCPDVPLPHLLVQIHRMAGVVPNRHPIAHSMHSLSTDTRGCRCRCIVISGVSWRVLVLFVISPGLLIREVSASLQAHRRLFLSSFADSRWVACVALCCTRDLSSRST